jgi:hypothetical protein
MTIADISKIIVHIRAGKATDDERAALVGWLNEHWEQIEAALITTDNLNNGLTLWG